MSRRWVVGPRDGTTVRAVLRRAHAPEDALEGGRVFVDGRRVTDGSSRIAIGQEVVVTGGPAPAAPVRVLDRGEGWLVVDKPAGVPSEPDRRGFGSVPEALTVAAGLEAGALHVVTRLDQAASGCVLVATQPVARRWLDRALRSGTLTRRYIGLASGSVPTLAGEWSGAIGRAARGGRRVGGSRPKSAVTRYRVVATASGSLPAALFVFRLVTGRTHQIRVHAAEAGVALLGDRRYGGPGRLTTPEGRVVTLDRVGLHACALHVPGPSGGRTVTSPLPEALISWWEASGGARSDCDEALWVAAHWDDSPESS